MLPGLSYEKGKAGFPAQIPPDHTGLPAFPDVPRACSFSCPCRKLILPHVWEREHLGTVVHYKATSQVLRPWPNPSIHSDFKLRLKSVSGILEGKRP